MKGVRSDNPLIRLRDLVWRPTPAALRGLALASVAGNALIMATGAAVRVSGSGLGCPTWPKCTGTSLVPTHTPQHSAVNMAIEFGNRLLTFLVLALGVAVFVAALRLRPRRRGLVRLAAIQPLSVVAQAIVGGIVVLTDLHPVSVTVHFLLSPAILAAAVVLWVRAGEGDERARPVVRQELVWLGRALTGVVFLLLVAGTVVTGTGPHAGDPKARRYDFQIEQVAQFHADIVWATVGLTFALLLGLRLTNAPKPAQRRALELLVVELAQGVIGYVQYFTNVPGALVVAHVLGAALVWIATLRLLFALRDRGVMPASPAAAPPAATLDAAPAASLGG
ncbi:COX15/CtaA family protein [Actinoallomurus spadix]|uniref:COX15/CtaA family protein n=1 Tax=Actinoallomurus spadix TaxID=79912 RepID=A0ABN0XQV4_9ACTN|nr:COX15/CtaA family protein [Actinoallomurus spadix]MCO5988290.1 COX15/CtaA family protein [Actinoallomurus spadix]